jgi:putative colanic acid biosynthesis acetyltransferase WcaF
MSTLTAKSSLGNQASLRHRSPYSFAEQVSRVAWAVVHVALFRLSPRPCWSFRRWLLRIFGAQVGRSVHIHNTARIYFPWQLRIGDHSSVGESALIYNLGLVDIGRYVTISQRSHLCAGTHDYTTRDMKLIRATIHIEDDVWVCADAFVGPNVTVHKGAIVGARAVVVKDIDSWMIVAGNPAKIIKHRQRQNTANDD